MKTIKLIFTAIAVFITFFINHKICMSQNPTIQENLDSKAKSEIVKNITTLLNENYIYPDMAKEMGVFILIKLNNNDYESITDSRMFGEQLTRDLQSVSKDKHLRVMFSPEDADEIKNNSAGDNKQEEVNQKRAEQMKRENYGFKKAEVLAGNIGYIDLRMFAPSEYSKETITSVMGFLSNCDAMIIDLRRNGGGDPSGVQMICSYFFDSTPVHLNDLYFRPDNTTKEFWTLKEVEGKRMPDIDLYVLTSNVTFSGAEEFTYNLKNLKRATIVGETTGGGAHPGTVMGVNESFVMFVPNGRPINPITKTDWEGTGISPDIEVAPDKALETAMLSALEKLSAITADMEVKYKLQWDIRGIKAELNPIQLAESILESYAGNYGERQVTFENGELYYQRIDRPKYKLVSMSEDMFKFSEIDYFRIKFVKDASGKVVEINGMYDNGQTDVSKKVN